MGKKLIKIYKSSSGPRIEVTLDKNTIWLDTPLIAELFGVNRPAIVKHINNIYESKELNRKTTCSILEQVAKDGKIRKINYYNLDMIISVGYRVNSINATKFRIWATEVLKKHLTDGYTINKKRLLSQKGKIRALQSTVSLLTNFLQDEAVSKELKGTIQIIREFSKALDILDDYDHNSLETPKGSIKQAYKLTYEEAVTIIEEMKSKYSASNIVGVQKDESFRSSLGVIYQTFEGNELYPSLEEKAAQLLYFIVKNHSFIDGNKRIAALIFLYFLQKNKILFNKKGKKIIDDNTLAALTLMIATSKPSEKKSVVKVVLNLMNYN